MHHYITILATFVILSYAQQNNDVIVKDLKLFYNSEEFFMKAIAYNPVPLGLANMSADGVGGGGYCSNLQTMWTEWKSACYDSDYFSGAPGSPGAPSPSNGWFTNIWERDLPIIKAMGANTLRIYNANPSTQAATTMYSNIFLRPYGKNHTSFMDYAQQYGLKVIFPLIGDQALMTSSTPSDFKRYLSWQIDEIGNHPALVMFTLGNELPLDTDSSLLALVNTYIGFARSYMQLKWNRVIPITSAVVDLPASYDYLAANLDVDVFTTNAGYRGVSFTDLWSGNDKTAGFFDLSCRYNKPVFIGEIGWQDMNNAIMQSIPNWFNQIWLDAINHINQGCIGGTFFEYSDEPLKAELQQTMGVVTFVESVVNGVSSLAANAWNPDSIVIKQIYNYVANGTTNGIPANFNADIFQIIGRAPYTLSNVPSTSLCAANFTINTCPTKSSFFDCSGNGICDQFAGSCACNVGWSGSDCSVGTCDSSCSGKGTCITTVSPPICSCDAGSDGSSCGLLMSSGSCPVGSGAQSACGDGNGICNNSTWTCTCHPGWTGFGCTVPTSASGSSSTTGSSTGGTSAPTSSPTTGSVSPATTGDAVSSTGSSDQTTTGDNSTGSNQQGSGESTQSAPTTGAGHNNAASCVPSIVVLLLLVVGMMM